MSAIFISHSSTDNAKDNEKGFFICDADRKIESECQRNVTKSIPLWRKGVIKSGGQKPTAPLTFILSPKGRGN